MRLLVISPAPDNGYICGGALALNGFVNELDYDPEC
jgi:hypothetical protein